MRQQILIATLAIAAAAGGFGGSASAEVFLLRSGGRIEGALLNPDREPGSPYQVRTDDGLRMALGEAQVARVVIKTDVEKQYEELRPAVANTVEGHWSMAEWCREAGLLDERKRHLTAVISIDPDHKDARKALGYGEFDGRWMTQDEFMKSQGYVRSKGAWRSRQEVELEAADRQRELAVKTWRVDIRNAFEQISKNNRHSDIARNMLTGIRDPHAAPALSEILKDSDQPRAVRLMCLDILGKLPPGLASAALVHVAMEEKRHDDIRDRCLDELVRQGAHTVLPAFLKELSHKDNRRVNLAAYCLMRLGSQEATLPLINALVTEHQYIVNPDGGGGGGVPINFNAGGGPGQGGLGGLSMGSKAKRIKMNQQNKAVHSALTNLHQGINFHFDEEGWRGWYIQNYTSTQTNLRRDE